MKNIHYAVAHRSQEEIDSFKSRYKDFDTSLIPEIFASTLQLTVTTITQPPSKGASHVIYIIQVKEKAKPLIFRANLGFNAYPEMTMKIEELVTKHVAKIGIPTNTILYVDTSRISYPFDFQIEEMLEGKDLETEFSGTKEEYDALSFELGQLVAKIHSLEYPKFGMFDEDKAKANILEGSVETLYEYVVTNLKDDIAHIEKMGIITYSTAEKILQIFENHKSLINISQGVLVHYDLADHNMMYQDHHISGIFDWEACIVGDPVIDLASCPTWKTHYPRLEKLLEGYQTVSKLPEYFQEKMNIYTLRTILWKTVITIRRGSPIEGEKKKRLLNALIPFDLNIL